MGTFLSFPSLFGTLPLSVFFVVVVVFGYVLYATSSVCVSVWVIEIINCSVFCTNSFIWISCWALAFWIIYQRFEKFKVRFPKKCAFLMRNLFLFRPAPFIWVCCLLHFHHSSSSFHLFPSLFSFFVSIFVVSFVDCVSSAVYRLCIAFFHFFSSSISIRSLSLSFSLGTLCYH